MQFLETRALRIVLRDQHGVVEHLLEPFLDGLQPSEIEAPVALVEPIGCEDEPERQGIAVEQAAMGIEGSPLPEAARQALVMAVGLGRPVELARRGAGPRRCTAIRRPDSTGPPAGIGTHRDQSRAAVERHAFLQEFVLDFLGLRQLVPSRQVLTIRLRRLALTPRWVLHMCTALMRTASPSAWSYPRYTARSA